MALRDMEAHPYARVRPQQLPHGHSRFGNQQGHRYDQRSGYLFRAPYDATISSSRHHSGRGRGLPQERSPWYLPFGLNYGFSDGYQGQVQRPFRPRHRHSMEARGQHRPHLSPFPRTPQGQLWRPTNSRKSVSWAPIPKTRARLPGSVRQLDCGNKQVRGRGGNTVHSRTPWANIRRSQHQQVSERVVPRPPARRITVRVASPFPSPAARSSPPSARGAGLDPAASPGPVDPGNTLSSNGTFDWDKDTMERLLQEYATAKPEERQTRRRRLLAAIRGVIASLLHDHRQESNEPRSQGRVKVKTEQPDSDDEELPGLVTDNSDDESKYSRSPSYDPCASWPSSPVPPSPKYEPQSPVEIKREPVDDGDSNESVDEPEDGGFFDAHVAEEDWREVSPRTRHGRRRPREFTPGGSAPSIGSSSGSFDVLRDLDDRERLGSTSDDPDEPDSTSN